MNVEHDISEIIEEESKMIWTFDKDGTQQTAEEDI